MSTPLYLASKRTCRRSSALEKVTAWSAEAGPVEAVSGEPPRPAAKDRHAHGSDSENCGNLTKCESKHAHRSRGDMGEVTGGLEAGARDRTCAGSMDRRHGTQPAQR